MLNLQSVKNYLAVDDNFRDAEIEAMILGAESFFERTTSHVFGLQTRQYFFPFRVYDFPIVDTTGLVKMGTCFKLYDYNILQGTDPNRFVELEVGYETEADIPADIVQCLYQIIKVWYFESENEQNATLFPPSVKQILSNRTRFLI